MSKSIKKFESVCNWQQMKQLALTLSQSVDKGFVLLDGQLGAGKTAFAQEFLKCHNIDDATSPTYGYVQKYNVGNKNIFHADLYRVEYATQLQDLELEFYQDELFLIEWGEQFEEYLQPLSAKIFIKNIDHTPDKRHYSIELFKPQGF